MKNLEKYYLWAIKIGLWSVVVLPLIIAKSMFFPFITGKNFAFRIIIEIIFALFVGLIVLKSEYRPKLTPIFKAVTIFILIVFLADIFGPNPYLSFFSNFERMEGFMMLFHLYLYFVMLISIFSKKDWTIFLNISIIVSAIISYYGFLENFGYQISLYGGNRVDSTIGNPIYLASYLLFHVWILLLMIYDFWKKIWLRIFYILLLGFELTVLYLTASRGAFLALGITSLLFILALIIGWSKLDKFFIKDEGRFKKDQSLGWPMGRKLAIAIFGFLIISSLFFWMIRGTDFVKSKPALSRLTNYSLKEVTTQPRFKVWHMSFKGFLERPILGWGQENYYLVYQKYYDPGLYDEEPWFDRSHNIIFDWLIHAGILGLVSYLSIILVMFLVLLNGLRKNLFSFWEGLVIMAVFISNFLQNLFVFDNLNTYILFFGFAAYGNYLSYGLYAADSEKNFTDKKTAKGRLEREREIENLYKKRIRSYTASGAMLAAVIVFGYIFNIKPIFQIRALSKAFRHFDGVSSLDDLRINFQEALNYNSTGNSEVREQIGNVARQVPDLPNVSEERKKEFIKFAIEELKKETITPAVNTRYLYFLGGVLSRAITYDPEYKVMAEDVLKRANEISPTNQRIAFELAQLYFSIGNYDNVLKVLERTWRLDKNVRDSAVHLWVNAILYNREDLVEEVRKTTDFKILKETDLFKIAESYRRIKDYQSPILFYEKLVHDNPKTAKYHATLAALLANNGRIDDAIKYAKRAAEIDPNFEADAKAFLETLK